MSTLTTIVTICFVAYIAHFFLPRRKVVPPARAVENIELQFDYLSKRIETIENEEQYYDVLVSIKTFEILFGEGMYSELLKDQLDMQMGWSRVGELCMN